MALQLQPSNVPNCCLTVCPSLGDQAQKGARMKWILKAPFLFSILFALCCSKQDPPADAPPIKPEPIPEVLTFEGTWERAPEPVHWPDGFLTWGFFTVGKLNPTFTRELDLGAVSTSAVMVFPRMEDCQCKISTAELSGENKTLGPVVLSGKYDGIKTGKDCLSLAEHMKDDGFTIELSNIPVKQGGTLNKLVITILKPNGRGGG